MSHFLLLLLLWSLWILRFIWIMIHRKMWRRTSYNWFLFIHSRFIYTWNHGIIINEAIALWRCMHLLRKTCAICIIFWNFARLNLLFRLFISLITSSINYIKWRRLLESFLSPWRSWWKFIYAQILLRRSHGLNLVQTVVRIINLSV